MRHCELGVTASGDIREKGSWVERDAVERRVESLSENKAHMKEWSSLRTVRKVPNKDMVQTEALPCGECDLGWRAGFSMQDALVAVDAERDPRVFSRKNRA